MDVGPVELILLTFPGERMDPAVVAAVAGVVTRGYVTVLDLIVIVRGADGEIRVIDFDEDLTGVGLGSLPLSGRPLISEDDLGVARDGLVPGSSAVVLLYEETWARQVAGAVRAAGGEVALHVQLPRDTVEMALAAASASE